MLAAAALAGALTAFVPVVVHDSREQHRLSSVPAAHVDAPGRGEDLRPAAYGRAVRSGDGGAWLQYWLFYPEQDQDRGIVRTGRHEGDWELVQVRLERRGQPWEVVYAQHGGSERCAWGELERRDGHPVVYAARGSHASYLRAGTRDRLWPDPNDEANGQGHVARPRLVRVSPSEPPWMRWPGHWGDARQRWWVPGEQDSPRGPAFQGDRWSDPDSWAEGARDCQAGCNRIDECDTPETLLGGGAAVVAIAGVVLFGTRRRRKP
jgi:Vacuolar protein sorting-associated protein 62